MGAKYQKSFIHYGAATVLLCALALSPFLYHAWFASPPLVVRKVAVLTAFSGPLQARGADTYAAALLAQQEAQRAARPGVLYQVAAMDDRGLPAAAADQARSVGADAGITAALCCSTLGTLGAVLPLLPGRVALLPLQTSTLAQAQAEAGLAERQFGPGAVALVSDETVPADSRRNALQASLQQAGFSVTTVPVDFGAGTLPNQLASTLAALQPRLVVMDADYPAAAWLGAAIRTAGATAPILGDDRLDSAEAARELAGLDPWWYVAPDRATLLRLAPALDAPFQRARGHAPSALDLLAYLQAHAAFSPASAPVDTTRLPVTLYAAVPGVYPGRSVATTAARGG